MLVIKVVCRWPLPPLSQRHLHLDNCASRMVARPKRKRMKKSSKIDSINIRRHHLGLTGIVYSEGYAYAVRYAPDTRRHRRTHSEKLAGKPPELPALQRLDGYVPVKERGAVAPLWFMGSFLGSNYVLPLGHSQGAVASAIGK